ncbi:IgGFc-binding protein-like [Dysidea avara]|uniref:IgGFc-binding protein-like n=1 Tax=Dysidea avara TaxID=196820 RepID=UPI00331A5DDC
MYCTYVTLYFIIVDHNFLKRDYYFSFFRNRDSGQPSIIIITSALQPVNYSVEVSEVGYYTSGNVTSDNEVIINLPTTLITSSHNDQDKGIHLMISSDRVTVIGQNLRSGTSDTFLCLPITNLCVDEYVYYGISVPFSIRGSYNSSILVVGTEDNTMMKLTVTQPVTISVSNSTVDLTAGIQYSFVINRLQTVLIESVDDLTGTKIVTNKLVSVLSGHQCGYVPVMSNSCDHLVEQVPPTTLWDRVYYTAPLATRRSYTIKVLAAYNSTVVDIYCNNTRESYNISEGESVNKTLSLQEYCAINSSKEVLVVQFSHGYAHQDIGDPMMTLVPATNQYSNKFQFSTLQGQSGYTHYINIIVLAQYYQPDMIYLISGGVNRSLDTQQWVPIMVNGVTEAYSVQVNVSEGVAEIAHVNACATVMSAIAYGFAFPVGYGHPVGIFSYPG